MQIRHGWKKKVENDYTCATECVALSMDSTMKLRTCHALRLPTKTTTTLYTSHFAAS